MKLRQYFLGAVLLAALAPNGRAQVLPLERDADYRLLDYAGFHAASQRDIAAHVPGAKAADDNWDAELRAPFDYGAFHADGGLLFVQQHAVIHIYDIGSDRDTPVRLGMFDTKLRHRLPATDAWREKAGGSAMRIERAGDILFIACEHYLIAVDITNPAEPFERYRLVPFGPLRPIHVLFRHDDTLIAVERPAPGQFAAFIDLADLAAEPSLRAIPEAVTGAAVRDGYFYAAGALALHTYRIGPDWTLIRVDSLAFPGAIPLSADPFPVNPKPHSAVMRFSENRLHIVDRWSTEGYYHEAVLTNPARPEAVSATARSYPHSMRSTAGLPVMAAVEIADGVVYGLLDTLSAWPADGGDTLPIPGGEAHLGFLMTRDGPYLYGVAPVPGGPGAPGGPAGGLWRFDTRDHAAAPVALPIHFFNGQLIETHNLSRGVTDGRRLYVPDSRSLVAFDLSDMSRLEPVGRTEPLDHPLGARRFAADVSGGHYYVLTDAGNAAVDLIVYDVNRPEAMTEVRRIRLRPSQAPTPWYQPILAIDAVGGLLFCAIPAPYRSDDDIGVMELLAFDIWDRSNPILLGAVQSKPRPVGLAPYSTAIDEGAAKIIYRDGYVYWQLNANTLRVFNATNPKLMSFAKDVRYGRSYVSEGEHERVKYTVNLLDIDLSRQRLYVMWRRTTRFLNTVPPPEHVFYDIYDLHTPRDPLFVKQFITPEDAVKASWNLEPLGGRVYGLNGRISPLDALSVTDGDGRLLAGGESAPFAVPYPTASAHIPFGATGLILRAGVTAYEMPGAVRPILAPEREFVRLRSAAQRLRIPIRNPAGGPMKWYAHDDPAARSWCSLWGRDEGEDGEEVVIDIARNGEHRDRLATIRLYAPGAVEHAKDIHLVQAAFVPFSLRVTPDEISVGANRWTAHVTIESAEISDFTWRAGTEASWIDLSESPSGWGKSTVVITLDPNIERLVRTGKVVFTPNDPGGVPATLYIRQNGRISGGEYAAADVQAVINALLTGEYDPELDYSRDGILNARDLQIAINGALGLY